MHRERAIWEGTAYSSCGMANAHRMASNFARAFDYFSQATALYQEIGDRISYAYTLWGEGTTYKMVGKDEEALSAFHASEAIFQETGDQRGRVYTLLGRGELAFLRGESAEAEGMLLEAREITDSHPFRLERCHCQLLQILLRTGGEGTVSLKEVQREYRRLGSDFPHGEASLPLNLP